jgi:F-type H+-transporting ATPase subunit delta
MPNKFKNFNQIVTNYAKSIFELSCEFKNLEEIERDFLKLKDIINNNPNLLNSLTIPSIATENKEKILALVIKECNFSKIMENFLKILLIQNRFIILNNIIEKFKKILQTHIKEKNITITSAYVLNEGERKEYTEYLSKTLNCKIFLIECVDPSIIGGIIIEDGTKKYNASILGKLNQLKHIAKQQIFLT